MLGLRLVREGVNEAEFAIRFGVMLEQRFAQAVAFGLSQGLTEWFNIPTGRCLRLTTRARFLANQAIRPFM